MGEAVQELLAEQTRLVKKVAEECKRAEAVRVSVRTEEDILRQGVLALIVSRSDLTWRLFRSKVAARAVA